MRLINYRFIFLCIILIFLISSFINARIFQENQTYYVEQDLKKGWNLIAGISFTEELHKDSEIILDEIFSSYYYDSKNKKNVEIRPVYSAEDIDILVLYSNAFWVYSIKDGKIIYKASPSFIDKNRLGGDYQFYSGKNLLAINDEMYGKSINEIKGDCEIKSIHMWNPVEQDWFSLNASDKLDFESKDILVGKGINIDVEEDCKFMSAILLGENKKDMTKYSDKEVFLISDKNWQDVLSLVPLTTWTQREGDDSECQRGYGTPENVCVYPTLIWHEEETGFDADSIIYFMQQYDSEKVTIIGSTPQELDNLLITSPELGAGLQQDKIRRISWNNYLSYWESYKDIVYVEDDYELGLMASTYASLINAPLIIQRTWLDSGDNFEDKNVICVGDVDKSCNENYNLEQLQKKYVEETNTDKIILVNPDDLKINVEEEFQPEKSGNSINEIYSKSSLAAPILAGAKHEVIISTTATNYLDVDEFIEGKIDGLYGSKYDVEYLTIIASPNAVDMSKESDYDYGTRKWMDEVDNYFYGNLDPDTFQELAVGRIFSLTISDISSYLARDLFYSEIPKENDFSIIWPGMPGNFWNMKTEGMAIEEIFESMGLNSISFITDERISPDASEFKNKFMLTYLDHAWTSGGVYNFNTHSLKNGQVWLNSPLVFMEGCGSCAFKLAYNKQDLFCANLLRRGAIFHYGATVDASATNWDPGKMIAEELLVSENIGQAVKKIRNKVIPWIMDFGSPEYPYRWGEHEPWDVLIGDPTFNPSLEKPGLEELTVSLNKISGLEYSVDIFIPEVNKNIEINYVETRRDRNDRYEARLFNYPFGNKIGRIYRESYEAYNNSNDEFLRDGYSDSGFLLFSINVPEGYAIKQIKDVEYINQNITKSVKRMPIFETGHEWYGSEVKDFNYVFYAKDEGSGNNYYFKMTIIYGGDPLIVKTQNIIPTHQFKIYLELEIV